MATRGRVSRIVLAAAAVAVIAVVLAFRSHDRDVKYAAVHVERGQMQAALAAARANVERSKASVADAKQKLDRAKQLAAQQLLPESDLDTAQATHDQEVAQLKANEAAVNQAQANVN